MRTGRDFFRYVVLQVTVLLWLASICAGQATPAPPTMTVYGGYQGQLKIQIPGKDLERPLDIAYDLHSYRLYALVYDADTYHVWQWSAKGKLQADWKLPADLSPVSILFSQAGRLKILLKEKAKNRLWEGSLLPSSSKIVLKVLPHKAGEEGISEEWRQYDTALQPDQVNRVRHLMKQLELSPSAREGAHVGDQTVWIDTFLVNARELNYDRLAWTPDLSVISLGSDKDTARLDVRQPDGNYQKDYKDYISSTINRPLGSTRADPLYGDVLAIVVSPRQAVYGLQLRRPDDTEEKTFRHVVVWLDITAPVWKVAQIKDGYLARLLERF